MTNILFVLTIAFTSISALLIPFQRNAIRALFLLASCLVGVAVIYLFLAAELLAVVHLTVYVGGVVVLIAIGILASDRGESGLPKAKSYQLWFGIPLAAACALLPLILYFKALNSYSSRLENNHQDTPAAIGKSLLENYGLPFEMAGFLLLCVIVSVLFLVGKEIHEKKS